MIFCCTAIQDGNYDDSKTRGCPQVTAFPPLKIPGATYSTVRVPLLLYRSHSVKLVSDRVGGQWTFSPNFAFHRAAAVLAWPSLRPLRLLGRYTVWYRAGRPLFIFATSVQPTQSRFFFPMYYTLIILILVVCFLLALVVLAQNPKGGGISSQFSAGGAASMMGVKRTGDLLEKLTWGFAIGLVVLSLGSHILTSNTAGPARSVNQQRAMETKLPAPTAPAAPAPGATPAPAGTPATGATPATAPAQPTTPTQN